jgi:predicted aspartyl protease
MPVVAVAAKKAYAACQGENAMHVSAVVARAAFAGAALVCVASSARAIEPGDLRSAVPIADAPVPPEAKAPRRFDAGTAGSHDQAAPGSEDDVLELRRDPADRMTVAVDIGTIAGMRSPFAFLVDTGAERTVIARSVADQLGLVPDARGTVVGMAGTREVDMVTIESISLGRRNLYAVSSPVLDAATIGADGIIGLDGLQGQRILLDFDHGRMALGDAAALGGDRGYDIIVRARRKSGQLIMTNATIDGVRTDIVIDTGSDTSIGNAALARALARDHRNDTVQLLSVTGQQATAGLGLARTIELGGMTLNNTLIAFSDAPPFGRLGLHKRPALLLGMAQLRLFHRVAIDFGARRILFAMPGAAPS